MNERRSRPFVHLGLFVLTAITTTAAGAMWAGADPFDSPGALVRGLPFSVPLLAILLCHEFGHYLMCVRHGVAASLPYFLPGIPIVPLPGTFGAVIRIRARFPNRRALFDMGAAGPWAGFVVAVTALVVGLRLSEVDPTPHATALLFGDSLLTSYLTRLVTAADPDTVVLHPIGIAGWFGLFVTSLNLIPAGQLDGGHVVYAATGRQTPLLGGVLAAIAVYLGIRVSTGWLLWAGIVALMTQLGHPPTLDDGPPLEPGRLVGAVASLVLFVLTFVPEPFRIML